MKSLSQILTAAIHDREVLDKILPNMTDRLSEIMVETVGIDGFFFPDLMEALSKDYYQFTPAQIRKALDDHGWVSICRMIPGRKDRVQVFVKKVRCSND